MANIDEDVVHELPTVDVSSVVMQSAPAGVCEWASVACEVAAATSVPAHGQTAANPDVGPVL